MSRYAVVFVAALLALASAPPPAQPPARPKLVVVLVVDQMAADDVRQFGRYWTAGLKRLTTQGAVFERAAYPYFNTLTCVGHATIATGSFPRTSGIVLNEWWDRDRRRNVPCAEDETVRPVGYGAHRKPAANGPRRLLVPTLAEQMRRTGSRTVALSLKPRSAIMLAGHSGDAVTWYDDHALSWATSSAYTDKPLPEVQQFIAANPIEADLGKTWTKSLPAGEYRDRDDAPGEKAPRGWTTTFPHRLAAEAGAEFLSQWEMTSYADAYVARMAMAMVDSFALGRRASTDFLGISFSTRDLTGHTFGPASHEVQDVLAGLDQSIGRLLQHLDATVGRRQYVVVLTADHGVAPIPEQRIARGLAAGRVDSKKLRVALDEAFVQVFGEGQYIEAVTSGYVYLRPGVADRLKAAPAALPRIAAAARSVGGIRTILDTASLSLASADRIVRAAALAQYPGRSGDLLIVPEPYYIPMGLSATHGSPYDYDQRVPLIFMGAGIRRGRYTDPASPADIAPTLAKLIGVTLPKADGHVLRRALAPARARRR